MSKPNQPQLCVTVTRMGGEDRYVAQRWIPPLIWGPGRFVPHPPIDTRLMQLKVQEQAMLRNLGIVRKAIEAEIKQVQVKKAAADTFMQWYYRRYYKAEYMPIVLEDPLEKSSKSKKKGRGSAPSSTSFAGAEQSKGGGNNSNQSSKKQNQQQQQQGTK